MEANKQQRDGPKELNDVRIGMSSIVGKVIGYCNLIITEKSVKNIRFTAVGGAIGKLVNVVESLKIFHAGLYQTNHLSTVSYQAVDNSGQVMNERLHPKLEVNLSFEEPKEKGEGFQTLLVEEERKALNDFVNARREERQKEGGVVRGRGGFRARGEFRGRGGFRGTGEFRGRGGFRGTGEFRGRGGFRARGEFRGRGGFRGTGEFRERGEFRPRGEFREAGEFRGDREEFEGERDNFGEQRTFRGGFRPRGEFRGRGGFRARGEFRGRGGFRGTGEFRGPARGRGPFQNRGRGAPRE